MFRSRRNLIPLAAALATMLAAGQVAEAAGTVPSRGTVPIQTGDVPVKNAALARKARLVEAVIVGTHAHQIAMAGKSRKGDPEAFGAQQKTPEKLAALVAAQASLLASDPAEVAKWVDGKPSKFDAAGTVDALLGSGILLDPRLPVNAATEVLVERAPLVSREKTRALASLLQIILEIDRDGTVLQDLFNVYKPLGLLVGPGDFRIDDSDRAFLAVGREMADGSCAGPFDTRRAAFQIGLRKIQNWSVKFTRDTAAEAADALLKRGDVALLISKIKAMAPERVLVVGHSYTMKMNWSNLSPMNEIVAAVFRKLNPFVDFGHMGHGGMSASQARDKYLKDGLAWKPNRVLVVVVMNTDKEIEALAEMARAFKETGAETIVFDQLYVAGNSWINPKRDGLVALAAKGEITLLEVGKLIEASPDKSRFVCLDGIHMTDPYHQLMAAELLKYLVGARGAKPAP